MKTPVFGKSTWIGLLAAAIVGGSATAVIINGNFNNQPSNPVASTPAVTNQVNQPPAERAVNGELAVYWIEASKNKLTAVPIAIKAKNNNEAIASVVKTLITENPPESSLYSAIPANTKILSMTSKDKDIRINFSSEFTKGGGSASMQGRIIQVLYTATSLDPDAKVYLSVDGKPLKYIGGEGLEVPQPMTRQDFALEF